MRVLRLWLLTATSSFVHVIAHCPCGFTVNSTSSTDFALFTESVETNFLQGWPSITWTNQPVSQWVAQEYNVSTAASRGPYGKAAQVGNVVADTQPTIQGKKDGVPGEPGLQLWVRQQLIGDAPNQLIPMAELSSARSDMLYGSFRASMKTSAVNGTCAGFFFYRNNSQEIDMESLSKQQQPPNWPLNLVNQSPLSVKNGFNADDTGGKWLYNLTVSPSDDYHEYRFDWLPNRIDFYVDGRYLINFTESIPDSPGSLHLSHWSNGNPNWSGGPPAKDAVLMVEYVKAYFNSSDPVRQKSAQESCQMGIQNQTYPRQSLVCPIVIGEPTPSIATRTTATSTTGATTTHRSSALRLRTREDGCENPACWAWWFSLLSWTFFFILS
ncbi:glycoside hydrolase family 16 protein [Acrodontium crateriforme]|uniref:Glycoside hydrolase family 16 protein n=1 Tax=Acrodontium crateriforme TaxID=150365 RepID=A0AAQ3M5Y3_9PEZI|nr:glycoside hydrolase family 16 protein [Acrodontium crateriforme]